MKDNVYYYKKHYILKCVIVVTIGGVNGQISKQTWPAPTQVESYRPAIILFILTDGHVYIDSVVDANQEYIFL